jgi:membrane protein YqaA with SNARE-associated domain
MFASLPGYVGLFVSSFVSATLLPGGSEFLLAALVREAPREIWMAIGVATVGNTLGALTSYVIGRVLPQTKQHIKAVQWLRQWGHAALLFSWLPIVGDALCVAAGWLKINPWWATLSIATGKLARYVVVAHFAKAAFAVA